MSWQDSAQEIMTRFPAKIWYQNVPNQVSDQQGYRYFGQDGVQYYRLRTSKFCWWNNYTAWSCRSSHEWYSCSHDNNPWIGSVVSKFGGCLILINSRVKNREHVATLGILRDSTKSRCWTRKFAPKQQMTIQQLQVKLMAFRKPSKMGHLEEDSEAGQDVYSDTDSERIYIWRWRAYFTRKDSKQPTRIFRPLLILTIAIARSSSVLLGISLGYAAAAVSAARQAIPRRDVGRPLDGSLKIFSRNQQENQNHPYGAWILVSEDESTIFGHWNIFIFHMLVTCDVPQVGPECLIPSFPQILVELTTFKFQPPLAGDRNFSSKTVPGPCGTSCRGADSCCGQVGLVVLGWSRLMDAKWLGELPLEAMVRVINWNSLIGKYEGYGRILQYEVLATGILSYLVT